MRRIPLTKKSIAIISVVILILTISAILVFGPKKDALISGKAPTAGKSVYYDRFMELYNDIQEKGYLSTEGIPYHSVETLMVEAPDYGHLTTSESFSFLVWLNATYGKLTGDWSPYKTSWDITEKYIIPDPTKDQPGVNTYPADKPAQFAPEAATPDEYPVPGDDKALTGLDPIANDLEKTYGNKSIYQMHWLLDVDNWYKYGNHGDGTSRCSYINTYQRGEQESVWETVPHPSWEDFKWGASDKGGFLSLFGKFGTPTKQWRYSSASDADARQVQASYWALQWAKDQGKDSEITDYTSKAAKMGDYLRYTFFDKYFRPIGVQNQNKAGTGYDSCHYLLSWYTSWGGDISGTWSWRIGSSFSHQGYQNPMAAYALSKEPEMKPKSQSGGTDWTKSLDRQIELYQYLQSNEGAIAGGVTNSWEGKYSQYPKDASTFYDMAYDWQPVYHDPASNRWFGFQAWSMERVMEYYYTSGDSKVNDLCDKWAKWAMSEIKFEDDGTYQIPSTLEWSGQPDTWAGKSTENKDLHCKVTEYTNDVGITACLAKALTYYAVATEKNDGALNEKAKLTAQELLDRMWKLYRDDIGVAVPETREDYKRFFDEVSIPKDYSGKNAQGAEIKSGITFLDMRPDYKKDPDFKKVEAAYKDGKAPEMKYHRFWAQADVAMANAVYHIYFGEKTEEISKDSDTPKSKISKDQPAATGPFNYGEALQKSIFFYECQRSGDLDESKLRMNWRGDSGLNDGKDAGLDLTGGWYDAGDHVKFNLPMAYTATMLSWSVYEYKEAFEKSGQLDYTLDEIKWATDYLIKCHPKPDEFYYQVGDGSKDHAWWGPAEAMQMDRPSYKVDSSKPGSTVSGEAAAALASASIIFKDSNPEYSATCLKHAKELFEFADKTKSDAGYTAANGFYNSHSGFNDELSWASVWLYLATNDSSYITKAESYVPNWSKEQQTNTIGYKWSQCWDDKHYGAELLLAKITGKKEYSDAIEMHLDYWSTGVDGQKIKYTPGGLAFLDKWGSLRYSTTTSYLAFVYSDWEKANKDKAASYTTFAKSQVDYALGNNPRKGSYVVGFGDNSPEHPHHRTAHSSWADSQTVPDTHRHVLYGALVGGPDEGDKYNDAISDYTSNEVACDYNAGLVGALAKMYLLHGGSPIEDFKPVETKSNDEFFVEASVNASGSNFTEIKAVLNNQSGWPARVSENLSFRYYMDLSELSSPNDLKVTVNFGEGVKVSGVQKDSGNIYYIDVDCSGSKVYPGGQSAYKKEVQFRIAAPDGATWNPENDPSYKELSTGKPVKSKYIPVYENGKLVSGDGNSTTKKTVTSAPTKASPTTTTNTSNKSSNSNSSTGSIAQSSGNGNVKVQFFNNNNSATTNSIMAKFKVVNTGSGSIKLSDLKLRYYYTVDGDKEQSFFCDWASMGNSNVTGKFAKISSKGEADTYLEIAFTEGAGDIPQGQSKEMQIRFAKSDWSNYTQTGDFSFNSGSTDYTDWNKIACFMGDKLVYGQEP